MSMFNWNGMNELRQILGQLVLWGALFAILILGAVLR
jgi:hypothetical protein